MPSYDVCICYHPKDKVVFDYCIASVRNFLSDANTIYVIAKENPEVEDIEWIPESLYPFSKEDVGTIIQCNNRVGWYYQQLLKLYCYRILPSKSEHILILDSDVIIKESISFFDETKIFLSVSPENHGPYFSHIKKLLDLEKQTEYSGIVHHMMTKRDHMEILLKDIEQKHHEPAWKAMILTVNPEDYKQSGMSEYELYFNYCLKKFPDEYKLRKLPFANCSSFQEFSQRKEALVAIHSWLAVGVE